MTENPQNNTKIAIVIRDDLKTWQKLNVTSFLTSGVLGTNPALIGEVYEDADGITYSPLMIQPIIVLTTDRERLIKIHQRSINRNIKTAIYIEDMFQTGNDSDNRNTVKKYPTEHLEPVGLALRAERKIVDKITKGAKMHP